MMRITLVGIVVVVTFVGCNTPTPPQVNVVTTTPDVVEWTSTLLPTPTFLPPTLSPSQTPISGLVSMGSLGNSKNGGAALSLDGRFLAIGDGPDVRIWSTESGNEVQTISELNGRSYVIVFSPDASLLALFDNDSAVEIWNMENGMLTTSDGSQPMSFAFSPDSTILASGHGDQTVRLWDTKTGEIIHTLKGHTGNVDSVAFSPDGSILASGEVNSGYTIKLWDVANGQEIRTLTGHNENVYSLSFSPDGRYLASASGDRTLKLWDVENGEVLQTFQGHLDRIYSVVYSPDGKWLVSGSSDQSVRVWDVKSGELLQVIRGSNDMSALGFSPDGTYLYTAEHRGHVVVWGKSESRDVEPGSIIVPDGNSPVIDGTISSDEWGDAVVEMLSDGSDLMLMHDHEFLYVGVRLQNPGLIVGNIFVDLGDDVIVLHSSAALGTAIYSKDDGIWNRTQNFVWRCRSTSDSASAVAEREKFLQDEGWVANNSYMGTPNELEYKIKIIQESMRLAVTLIPANDIDTRIYWPIDLDDDCILPTSGGLLATLSFLLDHWAALEISQ